jgi:hypothetical protein
MNPIVDQNTLIPAGLVGDEALQSLRETQMKNAALLERPAYRHDLLKAAEMVFVAAGKEASWAASLLGVTKQANIMAPEEYQEPVKQICNVVLTGIGNTDEEMVKDAAASLLPTFLMRMGAMTPSLVQTMGAASAAGGAGLGALGWYLNRDSAQDRDDIEVMKARLDAYNKISDEIEDSLVRSGYTPGDAVEEDELEEDTGVGDVQIV